MILRWLNRSLKRLSEKRSYYSDTPGKFVLLKELKRNFLQIFFVDNSCFCNFVAENEHIFVGQVIYLTWPSKILNLVHEHILLWFT